MSSVKFSLVVDDGKNVISLPIESIRSLEWDEYRTIKLMDVITTRLDNEDLDRLIKLLLDNLFTPIDK